MVDMKKTLIITDQLNFNRKKFFANKVDTEDFYLAEGLEIKTLDSFIKQEIEYFWPLINEKSAEIRPIFISNKDAIKLLAKEIDIAKLTSIELSKLRLFTDSIASVIINRLKFYFLRGISLVDIFKSEGFNINYGILARCDIEDNNLDFNTLSIEKRELFVEVMKLYYNFFTTMLDASIIDDTMAKVIYFEFLLKNEIYKESLNFRYKELKFDFSYLAISLKALEPFKELDITCSFNLNADMYLNQFGISSLESLAKEGCLNEEFQLYSQMCDRVRDLIKENPKEKLTIVIPYESKILSKRLEDLNVLENRIYGPRDLDLTSNFIGLLKLIFDRNDDLTLREKRSLGEFLLNIYQNSYDGMVINNDNLTNENYKADKSIANSINENLKTNTSEGSSINEGLETNTNEDNLVNKIFNKNDFQTYVDLYEKIDKDGNVYLIKLIEQVFNLFFDEFKNTYKDYFEELASLITNNIKFDPLKDLANTKIGSYEVKDKDKEKIKKLAQFISHSYKIKKLGQNLQKYYLHDEKVENNYDKYEMFAFDRDIFVLDMLESFLGISQEIDINDSQYNIINVFDLRDKKIQGKFVIFDFTNNQWDKKSSDIFGDISNLDRSMSKRDELFSFLHENREAIDKIHILASNTSVEGYEQRSLYNYPFNLYSL